jgi:hypothetical protein
MVRRMMGWKLAACLLLASVAASAIQAQSPVAQSPVAEDPGRSQLQSLLSFEMPQDGGAPAGWTTSPSSTVFTDRSVVHGGQWSARIARSADSPAAFSNFRVHIPNDFLSGTGTVWVRPTIAGIRAGRDEVLEAAIRRMVGP